MIINYFNFNGKKLINYKEIINNLIMQACEELNITKDIEFSLIITKRSNIKKINFKTRNINKATNVLSFPSLNLNSGNVAELKNILTKDSFSYDINPNTNNLFLGEILLCYKIIKKQAKKFNNTLMREMCYMTIHGFLHLLGFDHENEKDKKTMRELEEKVLNKLNITK